MAVHRTSVRPGVQTSVDSRVSMQQQQQHGRMFGLEFHSLARSKGSAAAAVHCVHCLYFHPRSTPKCSSWRPYGTKQYVTVCPPLPLHFFSCSKIRTRKQQQHQLAANNSRTWNQVSQLLSSSSWMDETKRNNIRLTRLFLFLFVTIRAGTARVDDRRRRRKRRRRNQLWTEEEKRIIHGR